MSRVDWDNYISVINSEVDWTDSSAGQWRVIAHWSIVDGRATLVGLDVRSFHQVVERDGGICLTRHRPLESELREVTQRVLRGIPIAAIRETTRAAIVTEAQDMSSPERLRARGLPESLTAHFDRRAQQYTAKGEPRKRTAPASSADLEEVARLYLAAVAAGDKTPAKTIENALRPTGRINERGGRDQVRKWIQRARERGLIPPVGERK